MPTENKNENRSSAPRSAATLKTLSILAVQLNWKKIRMRKRKKKKGTMNTLFWNHGLIDIPSGKETTRNNPIGDYRNR